jgi:hypothetical protein
MDDMDLDIEDIGTVVLDECIDEDEYVCDDVRPAWLSAELMDLDAETQIGFNAVWRDR